MTEWLLCLKCAFVVDCTLTYIGTKIYSNVRTSEQDLTRNYKSFGELHLEAMTMSELWWSIKLDGNPRNFDITVHSSLPEMRMWLFKLTSDDLDLTHLILRLAPPPHLSFSHWFCPMLMTFMFLVKIFWIFDEGGRSSLSHYSSPVKIAQHS